MNVGCTICLVHYNFTYCTLWYSHGHLAVLLQDHIICKIYILKSVIRRRTKRDVTLNSVNGKNITVDFLVLE